MANFLLGYQGTLYLADNPFDGRPDDSPAPTYTYNAVTWSELDNVTDVDGGFDSDTIDITTRAEAKVGWASEITTTKKGELTFTMRWKPGDARFDQLKTAWLTGAEVAVLDLDQTIATNGAQGLTSNCTVSFSQKKPVKGLQVVDVKLTVSSFPDWVTSDGTNTPGSYGFTAT